MNVDEVLHKHKVVFRNQGADYIVGCLNPQHEDSNPSMRIDKITGIFNCFACGFKGNIFKYFDAPVSHLEVKRNNIKKRIEEVRAQNIGLIPPADIMPYIGNFRSIKPKTYVKFGAFTHHESQFIGRVVFPIADITGAIRAFIGRHQDRTQIPKYLIYPPKSKLPLFPQSAVPILGRVILVEGIFDAINLHDKGLTNAMCCFGTQNIDTYKLSMLKFIGVRQVDIMFDGDTAGREAAEKVADLCEQVELLAYIVKMPDGIDPGDLPKDRVKKLKEYLYD
jgi:DNA primase